MLVLSQREVSMSGQNEQAHQSRMCLLVGRLARHDLSQDVYRDADFSLRFPECRRFQKEIEVKSTQLLSLRCCPIFVAVFGKQVTVVQAERVYIKNGITLQTRGKGCVAECLDVDPEVAGTLQRHNISL